MGYIGCCCDKTSPTNGFTPQLLNGMMVQAGEEPTASFLMNVGMARAAFWISIYTERRWREGSAIESNYYL
jgi:hypothetical protein